MAKAETKRYGHIGHPSYTYLQYIYISIYRSPTHATIIGTLDPVDGRTVAKLSQVRRYHGLYLLYLRNVAPCQDPCNGSYTTHIYITTTNIYIFTIYIMFAPGQDPRNGSYYSPMHGNLGLGGKERLGEVELEQEADPLDPLLTVGSYVQPGYIYVCDNY